MSVEDKPLVSVLMPVYNGERFLREAIDSILSQTFNDFEFLIINDGSTDRSREIILSYNDPRIRLIDNEGNKGLIYSLNKGLQSSAGEYIARMDCDDISLPERLAKQMAFMDSNPEVGVCGTWVKTMGGTAGEVWQYPTDSNTIKCRLLFESVLAHPSVMMRKRLLDSHNLIYHDIPHAEDYDLWARCIQCFPLGNIGEVLVLYRQHPRQTGKKHSNIQQVSANIVRQRQLLRIGINPSPEELEIHYRLSIYDFESSRGFVESAGAWILRLYAANNEVRYFSPSAFSRILGKFWYGVCVKASGLGLWTWGKFRESPLGQAAGLSRWRKMKFMVMCGIKYNG